MDLSNRLKLLIGKRIRNLDTKKEILVTKIVLSGNTPVVWQGDEMTEIPLKEAWKWKSGGFSVLDYLMG